MNIYRNGESGKGSVSADKNNDISGYYGNSICIFFRWMFEELKRRERADHEVYRDFGYYPVWDGRCSSATESLFS